MPSYLTSSARQTKGLAMSLAKELLRIKLPDTAVVLALQGELGSGKTTFVQGLAKGLGLKEKILSPTFVLIKRFQVSPNQNPEAPQVGYGAGRFATPVVKQSSLRGAAGQAAFRFQGFYHIDCYRIKSPKEILELGFKEIVAEPKNIVVVEWADKIKKILPKTCLIIKFKFVSKKKRRIVLKKSKVKCQMSKIQIKNQKY